MTLSALPAPNERSRVATAPTLHLVSAERDVVEPPEKVGSGLLAIGGPDFGPHLRVFPAAASDFRALVFEPLPGAAAEVEDVVTLWNEAPRGAQDSAMPALELRGEAATEDAFKRAAAGRRVVHLATHGFFLERTGRPSPPSLRGISGLVRDEAAAESPSEALRDNPLVLSGLALAGANRRGEAAPEAEDGVLTAEEIAGLDLHGLEWAVLSACDTGRGALQTGEGVLGLRRAFQIAGARTVIMSLWPVGDEMARAWMGRLYRGRFKEGRSSAEAVREAGLGMIQERRAAGAVTHPFYWGAFVASGDWR